MTKIESDTDLRERYRKMNSSFKRELVFHIGRNAGFFSEFNNMILAMLYCLENRIKFVLYSRTANFGFENGWSDFFLPFCDESSDSFHKKWNYRWLKIYHPHKKAFVWCYKKLKGLDLLTHDIWRNFKNRSFGEKHFSIPELGIDGDIQAACRILHRIVWQYNSETQTTIEKFKKDFAPSIPYAGVQLRGGDKITEHTVYSPKAYAEILKENTSLKRAFVLTDDYRLFSELQTELPGWDLYTSCDKTEHGYVHSEFISQSSDAKRVLLMKLFAAMDVLSLSAFCVVSYTANPGMNLGMRIPKENIKAVDYTTWQITW